QSEPAYGNALKTYCQQFTPEGGMYWADVRPTREQFVFDEPDRILAFAQECGVPMRGHTLCWYGAMPKWAKEISTAAEAERELTKHIETVVSRYRGKIKTWHVVNEPIDEAKWAVPGLRRNVWLDLLGDKYIDIAFRVAHQVDPECKLLINEYDIECLDGVSPK